MMNTICERCPHFHYCIDKGTKNQCKNKVFKRKLIKRLQWILFVLLSPILAIYLIIDFFVTSVQEWLIEYKEN